MNLLVLDFDGVICDSAPENAATGWRCCQRLWPEEFPAGPVPPEQVQRFCAIRPYLETGYQAILLTRLMHSGAPANEYTVDFAAHLEEHIAASGLTREELKRYFGGERDRWTGSDLPGWLSYNRLYPGVPETLERLRQSGDVKAVILTTKEDRFVKKILDRFQVPFPQEDIYGLERIVKKDIELERFISGGEYARIRFVEDRLATLERCAAQEPLAPLELAFASWGYSTDDQRRRAAAGPRIKVLQRVEELWG